MKLRIYFRPALVVLLLGAAAAALWLATLGLAPGLGATAVAAFAVFYSALFAFSGWALWRIAVLERWLAWDSPARLLILAPHEDDCVICAGGLGLRNRRLGGATRIVYLARDEAPGLPQTRAEEARAAWRVAGLEDGDLVFLDLLPPLRRRDPGKLRAAAAALRGIVDEFKPTAIVVPMFEGGHVHHDMTAALIGCVVTPEDRCEIFEAPEYGPYLSLWHTPHRLLGLLARWLFGLVAYYGPADGVDGRPVSKLRLDAHELDTKRRMLAAFASQNAPSLVATRGYPDRLVRWRDARPMHEPFDFARSYLSFVLAARRVLPRRLVDRLFPVQPGTVGREEAITDWRREWEEAGQSPRRR
ncbi:MAG: PIG-L family deacetylase [Reyranella sp.]|nr:PIG-L family deacetylase [Reyranella sp.]